MSRIVALAVAVVPLVLPFLTLALGLVSTVITVEPCPPADGC
jgi:hypothetical protein